MRITLKKCHGRDGQSARAPDSGAEADTSVVTRISEKSLESAALGFSSVKRQSNSGHKVLGSYNTKSVNKDKN